jgi:hypothetical protein
MKIGYGKGMAALIVSAVLMIAPAQAQLLGGLLGGSGDGTTVALPGCNSVTVGGDSGLSVGSGGGSGLGSNSAGVPDVAMASTSPNGGGGTDVGLNLFGGGNNALNVPLGGSNLGLGLPGGGAGGLLNGINGNNGTNGAPGTGGPNVVRLSSANAPGGGIGGAGGAGGGSLDGGSSKLRTLLNILQSRGWMRFVQGNAVCLPRHSVANIQNWLPKKDWGQLQQVVATYAQDIYTLRTMLANCRSTDSRLSETDLNRVLGVGAGRDGTPVLFML